MARKLKYIATKNNGSTEVLKFQSYNQARHFVDNNSEYKNITFAADPSDINYLSKISQKYLDAGERNLYVVAKPFTNAKFWKSPQDTHRMNIVNMLPGYIAYQWFLNNDESDEADEYLDDSNYFRIMGLWPEQIIGKNIQDASPRELETLIKFMIKNVHSGLNLGSISISAVLESLYNTICEYIPNDKITPGAAAAIQNLVIEQADDTYGREFLLDELPLAVWKHGDFIKKIINGGGDEDFPYTIHSIPDEILKYAENKFPEFKKIISNHLNDVEMRRQQQSDNEMRTAADTEAEDKLAKQQQQAEDEKKYSNIRSADPKEVNDKIQKNPSWILQLPKDMRTLDRWVLAASLDPFMITCAHEPGLREKIKAELDKTGEGELQRIKKLGGQ